MKLKYRRTHVPNGQVWIIDFEFTYKSLKAWICDCSDQIEKWNSQGVYSGEKVWHYDLIVEAI